MIESTNKLRIERPAWFVFKFIADIEQSPFWDQFNMRAIQTTPGPVGVGTEYRLVHSNFERKLRVVDYQKDRRISVVTLQQAAPYVELDIQVLPEGENLSLVLLDWKMKTGLPGLIERLSAEKIRRAISERLLNLRELLETGSVTLENGHEIHMPSE